MRYNAYFEMTASLFLVIIAVHFFTRRRFDTRLNRFFGAFIIICFFDNLLDVASAYIIESPANFPMWFNEGIHLLFFTCQVALSPLLYLYILCMNNYIDEKRYRRAIILSLIPAAGSILLLLLNPLTGMFFYFDSQLVYTHGPGFLGLYSVTVFYLAACLCVLLNSRKSIRRVEYFTMLTFIIVNIGAIVVQALNPGYLLTGVSISISVVMMYLTLQNPDDMLDSLSGAFTRSSFFTYIDLQLRRRERFQLIVFDIDNMAAVNELFGVSVGDRLIAEMGAYLTEIGGKNKLFRTVGDSFVLVTRDELECLAAVEAARERFKRRWSVGEISLDLSASICYSLTASECADVGEVKALLGQGIAASSGKGSVVELTRALHERIKRMGEVEELLRRSLDDGTVELFLQPVFDITKGRITGAEALSRLRDARGRIVMPGEFIPIAERSGLVTRLGAHMMDACCRYLKESGLAHDERFEEMCINLSVIECVDDGLIDMILSATERYDIPPGKICFEITETTATLSDCLPPKMAQLSRRGFKFALDDFGTGYANYDAIMRLPFNIAKFDKSMLDMSAESDKGKLLFFSTIEMLRSFGFDVIVEGVEHERQLETLALSGVNYAQGFYFARPAPASEFAALFAKGLAGAR